MKPTRLWQISISTSTQAEEAVAALLERLFGQSASVYLPHDSPQPVVTVFSGKRNENARAKRAAIQAGLRHIAETGLDPAPAQISIRRVPREDWSESWKKYFRTIEIGPTLLIKPSWSKKKARPGQVVVVLDPGLSFGTGQHPTTAFCLRQIVSKRALGLPPSLLDLGTGSGLLSIAAAKLGYSPVRALDSDPVAVRVAKANARKNRVAHRVILSRSDLTRLPVRSKTRYHLICANLVDSLLIAQVRRIVNRLHPDGVLVLSGILENQFAAVEKCYSHAGLRLIECQVQNGWKSGTFAWVTQP